MSNGKQRIAVALLSLSAAGFIQLVTEESYVEQAMVPTKGDRPTLGFGSTFYPDGSPVKLGDRTTPVRALVIAKAHVDVEEQRFRASLAGVYLTQAEFDLYMNWTYQFGIGNWRISSMRTHLQAGNYRAACDSLLEWRRQGGRDCALPENWGPQGCRGVWTRQQERHKQCLSALS